MNLKKTFPKGLFSFFSLKNPKSFTSLTFFNLQDLFFMSQEILNPPKPPQNKKPKPEQNTEIKISKSSQVLILLAVFIGFGWFLFGPENKKSQPSYVQPDHRPDLTPKNEPQTKNKKHLQKWQTEIDSQSYTAQVRSFFNEIGENYEEDKNWEEEMRQIVWHIRTLRTNNLLLSRSADLDEVNEVLIETIIKICHEHPDKVNHYDELEDALGPEFVLYVVFVHHPLKGGFASFVIIPEKYDAWNYMVGHVAEWDADLEFVGFLKLKQKQQIVVEDYEFTEVVPYFYIRKLVDSMMELFERSIVYGNGIVPIQPPTPNKRVPSILEQSN